MLVHKEKRVVDPAVATLPSGDKNRVEFWTFAKEKPLKAVKFADGTEFKFPLQRTHEGGYDPVSRIDVADRVLAENLKQAIKAGDTTLREITA